MAKKFENAGSAKTFKNVAEVSAEKARVITLKMIPSGNLIDYPKNGEDITDTTDLENSIKEIGFTDPIEVTTFGQPEGKYMILSGHRRRAAGVKCGIELFPCVIKSFLDAASVHNYVLLANSHRDSARDPLLYAKRYKMHEAYLREANYTGNYRDEIAKRLGISIPQADRYNALNRVITPVLDLIPETLGMSSAITLAAHTPEEQSEIFAIMGEVLESGDALTRDNMKRIVEGYRRGFDSWEQIKNPSPQEGEKADLKNEEKPPVNEYGLEDTKIFFDAAASVCEISDNEAADDGISTNHHGDDESKIGHWLGEKKSGKNGDVPMISKNSGKKLTSILKKLENCFYGENYSFEEDNDAEKALRSLGTSITSMLDEMYYISRDSEINDIFKSLLSDILTKCNEYKN